MPSDSGAGRLVSPYLRRLALPGPWPGRAPRQAFVDAGLDLAVSAPREASGLEDRADPRRRGWVREQRLRRCRDDRADQRLGHLAVAEIAGRWGFRSAAHFCRAFEARYGITPSACRNRKIAGLEGPAGAR